ncbi:hypothetical protein B0H11DRAFT_2219050 [Mycena galericulata]|nr:hypothetical protein B0H11DRAFT_2219050 [Mycena galericulata]
MPPMRDVPDVRMPVPAVPPGAGTGVPLEPAEQPPQVVPFTYDVQERGLRPRSGVGVTVPAGQPPPRARTVPLTTQGARRRPVLPQDFRDAPRDRFRAPPRAGPSEPETFFTQPVPNAHSNARGQTCPTKFDLGPPAEPVMISIHQDAQRLHQIWVEKVKDAGSLGIDHDGMCDRLPPSPGPSVTMQGVPPVVQLPPVFDSLMEILRENRLAQLATVDQQRELMRYMRGLNEWLERDVHDRQAELRGVVARVDQLRDDMRARAIPAQGAPGPPGGDDSGSSDGSDGPPVILPDQGPPVVPRPPPESWQRPGFQPLHYQPFPVIPR